MLLKSFDVEGTLAFSLCSLASNLTANAEIQITCTDEQRQIQLIASLHEFKNNIKLREPSKSNTKRSLIDT